MTTAIFYNPFFSLNMHQIFNRQVARFESDETENALHKFLRATGQL